MIIEMKLAAGVRWQVFLLTRAPRSASDNRNSLKIGAVVGVRPRTIGLKEEEWEQGMWIERATVGELSTRPLGANPEPPSTDSKPRKRPLKPAQTFPPKSRKSSAKLSAATPLKDLPD